MPVHKVKGGEGYQFGTHGKVYSTKEQAKKQQTAIYASVKYCEEAGTSVLNGKEFTHVKVYKGSSEFDKREMSILIDGIVDEAKTLGIETLTSAELERMKLDWKTSESVNLIETH